MIGWATKETVQSARRTLDSDGWRYPQDCRIHRRRQTAGLAQRVDVLHSPRILSWLCSRWSEEGSRGLPALASHDKLGFPWLPWLEDAAVMGDVS